MTDAQEKYERALEYYRQTLTVRDVITEWNIPDLLHPQNDVAREHLRRYLTALCMAGPQEVYRDVVDGFADSIEVIYAWHKDRKDFAGVRLSKFAIVEACKDALDDAAVARAAESMEAAGR